MICKDFRKRLAKCGNVNHESLPDIGHFEGVVAMSNNIAKTDDVVSRNIRMRFFESFVYAFGELADVEKGHSETMLKGFAGQKHLFGGGL